MCYICCMFALSVEHRLHDCTSYAIHFMFVLPIAHILHDCIFSAIYVSCLYCLWHICIVYSTYIAYLCFLCYTCFMFVLPVAQQRKCFCLITAWVSKQVSQILPVCMFRMSTAHVAWFTACLTGCGQLTTSSMISFKADRQRMKSRGIAVV